MREKKENDMNKKTKLLLVLLSSTALTAGAFGLAACSGEAHNEEYYAQYQQYVSATAEGEVLSYEDWLIGILEDAKGEKGDKGDKGDTGEAGKAGTQWTVGESDPAATSGADGDFYLNKTTFDVYNKVNGTWTKIGSIKGSDGAAGATGDGIDTIVYKGGALEVTLKSGSKITVALPDEITHVHTYGETLTTLIEPTVESEGLAYKECTDADCGHIELVAIPKLQYEVTVTYEGSPLAGVNVTLSGEGISEDGYVTVATDEDGKVVISPDAVGAYVISVDGYTILGNSATTADKMTYSVDVAKAMNEEVNGWGETTYSVEESGTYAVTVTSGEEDWGWGPEPFINCQAFDIVAGEENAKVKVSLNSTEGVITDAYGYENNDVDQDGSYTKIIRAGETDSIGCSINSTYFETGKYTYGDTIVYSIKVEYLEAPADGTVEDLSIDASALTEEEGITMTAEPDQWIYFNWTNPDTGYRRLNVTLGEGTTLEFMTKSNWTDVPVTLTESGVVKFTDSALSANFSFKVKSSTGNISLSADFYAELGEQYNPAELALDTAATGTVSSSSPKYYYKWTATEAGNYTLVVNGSSTAEVYSDAAYEDLLLNIQSDLAVFNAEAGATYYIAASTKNVYNVKDYSITLRKTTADDAGYSAAYPIELTSESVLQFNDFDGTRYYSFTNSGADPVTFKLVTEGNEDTYISLTYYSDNTYSSSIGYGDTAVTVEAGQTIYVLLEVYAQPNNFTGTATVEIGVPEPPVEPDIPEGVDPGEVQIPSGGNAIAGVGYWQISVTAEDVYEDYFEVMLYFTGEAGTYNVTCQEGSSVVDSHGAPMTQIVSTGTAIRFYFDADKVGDYIITITAVTEEA